MVRNLESAGLENHFNVGSKIMGGKAGVSLTRHTSLIPGTLLLDSL